MVDAEWFPPNAWPAETPGLRRTVETYTWAMRTLADELLALLASALGLPEDTFTAHTEAPDVDVPGQLVPVDGRGR